jgi:hypothetical protein
VTLKEKVAPTQLCVSAPWGEVTSLPTTDPASVTAMLDVHVPETVTDEFEEYEFSAGVEITGVVGTLVSRVHCTVAAFDVFPAVSVCDIDQLKTPSTNDDTLKAKAPDAHTTLPVDVPDKLTVAVSRQVPEI